MPHVTTSDGTTLHVKDWGSGPAVILLHGWPLSADSWDDHAMALAQSGFRAIAYDRRGFGRSSQPLAGYDYDTLADDLAAVIERTGARDVTLVGFSMGGGEVARYLSRHGRGPGPVVRAALVASVLPYMLQTLDNPHGIEQSVFDGMQHGVRQDRAQFFNSFFRDFYGMGLLAKPVSEELLLWSRQIALQAALPAVLGCAQAFATTDFRPDLPAFEGLPTLIIHGTDDRTVPIEGSARAAARSIRHATLMEYAGAPHGLLVTERQRVLRDLLNFLRG